LEKISLEGTAPAYYYRIKYFLDSIMQGVYPLWNPFSVWGSPDVVDMRALGEYNPFLYSILLFKVAGLSFYKAYLVYMASYYLVGLIGFYLLSKEVMADKRFAYVAYVVLMFSSLSQTVFTENVLIYMFVSIVWFFYFLLRLVKAEESRYWLGLTFCLIIIFTTYLPFYFLLIFLFFLLFFILFYFRELVPLTHRLLKNIRNRPRLIVFCILALGCSLLPILRGYQAARDPAYLMDFHHRKADEKNFLVMDIDAINLGGVTGPLDWQDLFSEIGAFAGRDTVFVFVTIFLYLLVPLTVLNRINRRSSLLFCLGFILFMVSLADAAPVHRFLYEHIYFVRLFRNLFFLLYLAIPVLILFGVDQFRLLLSSWPPMGKRGAWLIFIISIHLLVLLFLMTQEDIIRSSYLTIIGSLMFFTLWGTQVLNQNRLLFLLFLLVIILIQPIEVFHYLTQNAQPLAKPFRSESQKPHFTFQRPLKGEDLTLPGISGYASELKLMQDRSGFVDHEYIGLRKSHDLQRNMDYTILQEYIRHKFIVYDKVEMIQESNFDLKSLEQAFSIQKNVAYVFGDSMEEYKNFHNDNIPEQYFFVTGNSPEFEVLGFGLNFIKFKTNFNSRKFLVYNDSFHKEWWGYANQIPIKIWRANWAFKGIWLDPGENIVYLRYGKPWLHRFHFFLISLMFVLLGALVILFLRSRTILIEG